AFLAMSPSTTSLLSSCTSTPPLRGPCLTSCSSLASSPPGSICSLSPRLHPVSCGFYHAPNQLPQRRDISPVVARLIDRRLQNKRAPRQQRMIQNSAKRFHSDFAFADVFVPVHARPKHRLRIVYVQHKDAIEPHRTVN